VVLDGKSDIGTECQGSYIRQQGHGSERSNVGFLPVVETLLAVAVG